MPCCKLCHSRNLLIGYHVALPSLYVLCVVSPRRHVVCVVAVHVFANSEAKYGQLLAPYLSDPSNLFIISSDFCHWGSRFKFTFTNSEQVLVAQQKLVHALARCSIPRSVFSKQGKQRAPKLLRQRQEAGGWCSTRPLPACDCMKPQFQCLATSLSITAAKWS